MSDSANWLPNLEDDRDVPGYEKIMRALERDIRGGALAPGQRLPTHRALAERLGLSIGTVSKAYGEAERRGIITAAVGRGTYVSGAHRQPRDTSSGSFDLASNLPPRGIVDEFLQPTLAQLSRDPAVINQLLDYSPPGGLMRHREAGSRWLGGFGVDAPAARVVVTLGAQHAVALTFGLLCRPGDSVMVEAASFFGVRSLARQLRINLVGVAMDAEGLLPEALDSVAAETGASVLYTLPTLQNPTARTMSLPRRRDLVEVARRRGIRIVEGDVHGLLLDARPPPIVAIAPDITFYATSMSKIMAPGLRVGFLVLPPGVAVESVFQALRAIYWTTPQFGPEVVSRWIVNGMANEIVGKVRGAARARFDTARRVMPAHLLPAAHPPSFHFWLPMSDLEAERVARRAMRRGVMVTPPGAPIVSPELISGIRVCLGAAPDMPSLETGLRILLASMGEVADAEYSMV